MFTATPDDDMEHVHEENQNETGFEFVLSDYSLSDGVLSQQFLNLIVRRKLPIQNCVGKSLFN